MSRPHRTGLETAFRHSYPSGATDCVARETIRRVWAVVTQDPNATIGTIGQRCGITSRATIAAALHILRDAGYIEFVNKCAGGRRIIIPFYVQKQST